MPKIGKPVILVHIHKKQVYVKTTFTEMWMFSARIYMFRLF